MKQGKRPSGAQTTRSTGTRRLLVAGAVAAAVAAAAIAFSGRPAGTNLTAGANAAHGKELYGQYCVACHGLDGIGEFNWQNRPRSAPALNTGGHAWHHEDEQLLSMILDKPLPDSRMPAWRSVLSQQDARDLVAYIKTLWTPYIRDNCQGARHMQCMMSMR